MKTTTTSGDRLKKSQKEATVSEYEVHDVEASDYPGNFAENPLEGEWDLEQFMKTLKVDIVKYDKTPDGDDTLEFDIIGICPAIANAFRRILIAEVPTIAIERVEIMNNTSLLQDDFLAHRLGLIPLKVDPFHFDMPSEDKLETAKETLILELKHKCFKEGGKSKEDSKVVNREVYTEHIKWVPIGGQEDYLFNVKPVQDKILIAKLSPGQELDLRLVCVKGIGRDHAKFSPVCTASYRLLPKITMLQEVYGDDAQLLKESFSQGVIEVKKGDDGRKVAQVVDSRKDMCSRNIYRHEHLRDTVEMTMIKDHYIFTVESTGALAPEELMMQSIDILIAKCNAFIVELVDVKR
ncbi:DNA-directed RNA polymerases I and III subunit RPAC1 [Halotydeus destructor]|nr:DNA-directed RNA polymerases I and III subunit RPAC1 [Halotydeus destructor]